MPSPFPGMDPYLEHRALWADVHATLVPRVRALVAARLPRGYHARLGERIVIWGERDASESLPDLSVTANREFGSRGRGPESRRTERHEGAILVRLELPVEIREPYIEIYHRPGESLVAAIEVLSYSNKLAGADRERYLSRRREILRSSAHLVEIDLLRAANRMPLADPLPRCHYLVLVSPTGLRPNCQVFPFSVRDPIPDVEIPLRERHRVSLSLAQAVRDAYGEARYDDSIDYSRDPTPRFAGEDARWVKARARKALKK